MNSKHELIGVIDSVVFHRGGAGTPISRAIPLTTFLPMKDMLLSGNTY